MTIIDPDYVDVGFGCRCESSSGINAKLAAHRLQPSLVPGGYFFHTAFEQNPWLVVDLGVTRAIERLRVFAREEFGDNDRVRSYPLLIETSEDGVNYAVVLRYTQMYGGRITKTPLEITFTRPLNTRYLRFMLQKADFFHLDYVEVSIKSPVLRYGATINTTKEGDDLVCDYVHQGNSGLYSALSTALSDISTLSITGFRVRTIDFGMSFIHFKTVFSEDVYRRYFRSKHFEAFSEAGLSSFHWSEVHRIYKNMDLIAMRRLALNFFEPSHLLQERVASMRRQLAIDPEKTIAIVYRGTDKVTEVKLATPSAYIEVARKLANNDRELRVVAQTDQAEARAEICDAFGERCSYFDQLPVSTGDKAIHLDFERVATQATGDKDEWALNMMAVVVLLSQMKYLVTHTGNISAWICFYRGSAEGVFQFDKNGSLVEPAPAMKDHA